MGRRLEIPPGTRFNNRVVLKEVAPNKWKQRQFLCRCDCGSEVVTTASDLQKPQNNKHCANCWTRYQKYWKKFSGKTGSMKRTHAYMIWEGMCSRAIQERSELCKEWADFDQFFPWYLAVTGLSLDDALMPRNGTKSFFRFERIDTEQPWGPDNISASKFKTERAWDTTTYAYWKQLNDNDQLDESVRTYKDFINTFGLKLPYWFLTKRDMSLPHSKSNSFWKNKCLKTT